jgi:hypothetical protein
MGLKERGAITGIEDGLQAQLRQERGGAPDGGLARDCTPDPTPERDPRKRREFFVVAPLRASEVHAGAARPSFTGRQTGVVTRKISPGPFVRRGFTASRPLANRREKRTEPLA